MPGELAVLERHRLLCLIEHRGELQIRGELAVDRIHRGADAAPLLGIRRERTREPPYRRCGGGDDRGKDVGHRPIVARPCCMHGWRAIDTSDVL